MIEKLRDCVETLLEEALLVQLEGKVSGGPLSEHGIGKKFPGLRRKDPNMGPQSPHTNGPQLLIEQD